jgi:glycosyltransferase involved in cell wall biosynthesis
MARIKVVCCSEVTDPNWRWIAPHFADADVKFEFARCLPRGIGKINKIVNLARLLGCLKAVMMAGQSNPSVLVTHGPTLAAWCALFARLLRIKVSILAHSFNFVSLPGPIKSVVFRYAFSKVDRFVVFSQIEKETYSKVFDVPIERFDFVRWGVQVPNVDLSDRPIESGRYAAAIGGNARDYRTLIEAARDMPDLRFALVIRPEGLKGLDVPPNVSVHVNISFGKAMNILRHSRFMVLTLIRGDVPCGHVTLVAAMHLGRALVVTNSRGVRDYVFDGENAILVESESTKALIAGMRRLWEDGELCQRLGENGRIFAANECTEARIATHFRSFLSKLMPNSKI